MQWRNKPLFRRETDVKFKTGVEASKLLIAEVSLGPARTKGWELWLRRCGVCSRRACAGAGKAKRRDPNEALFNQTFSSCLAAVSGVFDRNPKNAWIAKQLNEP